MFSCLRRVGSILLVISVAAEQENGITDKSLRQGSQIQTDSSGVGPRELSIDELPPSSELWCSFLNFCVDDDTLVASPPPSPTNAPESTMNALCTFLRLCDTTTAPPATPTPSLNSNEMTSTNQGSDLLDACVHIGLCVLEASPPTQTLITTATPSVAPTFPAPPQWESVCEFLGNCDQGQAKDPTGRPTLTPTPSPTQKPASSPLENDTAVDFLCSILGWCGDVIEKTTLAPISAVSTPQPTPAPPRPTLLCLVSRMC